MRYEEKNALVKRLSYFAFMNTAKLFDESNLSYF